MPFHRTISADVFMHLFIRLNCWSLIWLLFNIHVVHLTLNELALFLWILSEITWFWICLKIYFLTLVQWSLFTFKQRVYLRCRIVLVVLLCNRLGYCNRLRKMDYIWIGKSLLKRFLLGVGRAFVICVFNGTCKITNSTILKINLLSLLQKVPTFI